jgi:Concanavalin A-like lectin/glucanases superfamily
LKNTEGVSKINYSFKNQSIMKVSVLKIVFFTMMIALIFSSCSKNTQVTPAVPSTEGLVAYFPLDGTALDESSFGNNGQIFGAQPARGVKNEPNSAFFFNGETDYIKIPHSGAFNFGKDQDFTLSVWIKFSADQQSKSTPDNDILSKWVTDDGKTTGYPFVLRVLNSTKSVTGGWYMARWDGNRGGGVGAGVDMGDNQFHHIVATKKGTVLRSFVDGKLKEDNKIDETIGETKNIAPLIIGGRQKGNGPFFKGYVDELRIYNRTLTDEEVSNIFNSEKK